MNIGFFSGPSIAFATALDIGTRKSPIFSFPSVLPPLLRIGASSPVLFKIPKIPAVMFPITPSLLVSKLTTLFTSWRIPRLRTYSAAFSVSVAKWIFMGIVEWFLGVHFSWQISLSLVLVHMNQLGFASNLVESFFFKAHDANPLATPYRSRIPVNSIAPLTDTDNSPTQIRRT